MRVFEALHELGGVLVYGIPEFRLPKEIVRQEVDVLAQDGRRVRDQRGRRQDRHGRRTVQEEGYDAVFIATGAGLPQFLGVPGENLNGVYSANEFLTRVNLMRAYQFPEYDEPVYDCRGKDVAVVGGGNTAMDAVRTALRLGAKHGYLVYRRSETEMPARIEEVNHAKEEGVQFLMLTNPVEFLGDETAGCAGALPADGARRARRVRPPPPGADPRLGVRDAARHGDHRRRHERQPARPGDDAGPEDEPQGLHRGRPGDAARPRKRGVFAGGDIVTGGATVILAMGAGRKAARAIDEYLKDGLWIGETADDAAVQLEEVARSGPPAAVRSFPSGRPAAGTPNPGSRRCHPERSEGSQDAGCAS